MKLSACPSAIMLDEFFAGNLPTAEASLVESHLSSCAHCLTELQRRDAVLRSKILGTSAEPKTVPVLDESVSSLIRILKVAGTSTATIDLATTPASASGSTVRNANEQQAASVLRYQPLRSHAKGGLGEVFVARDRELQREVALKEIQSHFAGNEECRARFVSEAEITGNLEHPGIVPVYGLGVYSDGRPYYAMRFIRGDNLQAAVDRYHCDDGSPLGLRQLLTRFIHVCNAIAYAHSRGVIHRDLKPSNIMLGDFGETLVVDWGLAKIDSASEVEGNEPLVAITGVQTHAGRLVGTPAYMSPEQAAGKTAELTPATDIYSLGATLFYLLTARPPHQAGSVEELLQRVQQGAAEWPQGNPVARPLRAICDKAMAIQPANRYATASELAGDLENWLADEPVTAWREPVSARVRRWMRKHSRVVAATSAAAVVGIIGLFAIVAILKANNRALTALNFTLETSNRKLDQANRDLTASNVKLDLSQKETEKKRQEAETERQIAKAVRDFLQHGLLRQADPAARLWDKASGGKSYAPLAANPTVQELLDRAALEMSPANLEASFPGQPIVQAEILATVGDTYSGLGDYAQARDYLERARSLSIAHLGPDHPHTLAQAINLAIAAGNYGEDSSQAIALLEDVVSRRKKTQPPSDPQLRSAKRNLALAYLTNDQPALAIRYLKENLESEEDESPAGQEVTIRTMTDLGRAYLWNKQTNAAIEILESANQRCLETLGEDETVTLTTRMTLADAYEQQGRHSEALAIFQDVLAGCEGRLGPDHPLTLNTLGEVAESHVALQQFARGIELGRLRVERSLAKFGPEYFPTLSAQNQLALALQKAKKHEEAIKIFAAVHAVAVKKLSGDHNFVMANLSNLADSEVELKDFKSAAEHYEAIYEWRKKHKGENDPDTLRFLSNLTICLGFSGQHERATPLFEAELADLKRRRGPAHKETLECLRAFGMALCRSGAPDRGLALYEEALAAEAEKFGSGSSVVLNSSGLLAREYLTQKRPEKALPLIEEVVAGYRKLFPAEHPMHIDLLSQVGLDLIKAKEYAAAEPYLREALQRMEIAIKAKQRTNASYQKVFLGEALLGQSNFAEGEPLIETGWNGLFANGERDNVDPAKLQIFLEGLERLVAIYKSLDLPEDAAKWQKELDDRRPKP